MFASAVFLLTELIILYACARASLAVSSATSIGMPGPMVEQRVALLTYLPFATEGFAFKTAVMRLEAFSTNLTGSWSDEGTILFDMRTIATSTFAVNERGSA